MLEILTLSKYRFVLGFEKKEKCVCLCVCVTYLAIMRETLW